MWIFLNGWLDMGGWLRIGDGKFLSAFELVAALHVPRPVRCAGRKIEMKTSKVSASEDKILN